MNGLIIYNGTLNIEKITKLVFSLKEEGENLGVAMKVLKNTEIIPSYESDGTVSLVCKEKVDNIDFIIFWDKDIILAKHLEKMNYKVFNRAEAIEICDHKGLMHLKLSQAGIRMPKTILSPMLFNYKNLDEDYLLNCYEELGSSMIIKESKGSFGMQVYNIKTKKEFIDKVRELSERNSDFIMQENIESSYGRDIRVNIIGDEVVGSMYRESKVDFRANMSQGGRAKVVEITHEQKEIALKAHRELGLDFSGVDLLFGENDEPILCEVNSNLNYLSFEDVWKKSFGELIIKYIVGKCNV